MPNAHELFGRQTRIGAKSEKNRFVGGNIVDKTALESRGADSIAQRRWIEASILHEAQQFFRVLCQIAKAGFSERCHGWVGFVGTGHSRAHLVFCNGFNVS